MVTMNEAQHPYEHEEDVLGQNEQVGNDKTKSNGIREEITPPSLIETIRSFHERLIKDQEEKTQINASIFQSLIYVQQRSQLGSNPSNSSQGSKGVESHSRSHTRRRSPSLRNGSQRRTLRYSCQDFILGDHVILKIHKVAQSTLPIGPRGGDLLEESHMENLRRKNHPYMM